MKNYKLFLHSPSKKFFLSIFILMTFNINIIKSIEMMKNIIVIPFKEYHPKISDIESKHIKFLTSRLRQKLYLDMENISGQKISMILTLENIISHTKEDLALIDSTEKYIKLYTENISDICTFNHQKSENFKCLTPKNIFFKGRNICCVAEEKLLFYIDENLKEKISYPFKFIHSTGENNICLFSSFKLHVSKVYETQSFIEQLKVLSGAKSYSWILKYTDESSGLFIFGDIINNDKIKLNKNNGIKNIDNNYKSIYMENILTNDKYYKFKSDKLIFGDNILAQNISTEIDTEIPFILLTREHYTLMTKQIFNKYFNENICTEDSPFYQIMAIICNKKLFLEKTNNLMDIPSLTFQINQYNLNITFSPNDLFKFEGDDIYFMVARHSYKESQSILGLIFLKKYPVIFDDDSKLIKIMRITYDNEDNDENNNGAGGKVILIVFLSIILSGIIFGSIGLIYGKKINQVRKKKANELDDNYEYKESKRKEDISNENKYGLFEESKNIGIN